MFDAICSRQKDDKITTYFFLKHVMNKSFIITWNINREWQMIWLLFFINQNSFNQYLLDKLYLLWMMYLNLIRLQHVESNQHDTPSFIKPCIFKLELLSYSRLFFIHNQRTKINWESIYDYFSHTTNKLKDPDGIFGKNDKKKNVSTQEHEKKRATLHQFHYAS